MEHNVLKPEKVNQGDCCAAQTSSYKKLIDFSVAAQLHVLISVAMPT